MENINVDTLKSFEKTVRVLAQRSGFSNRELADVFYALCLYYESIDEDETEEGTE